MTGMTQADRDLRSIEQARRLAERAAIAARELATLPQERIDGILEAMRRAAEPLAEEWARRAVEETGFGNVADKTKKNLFATVDLHEHIRGMRTVGVLSENPGTRVVEIASPVGVVAAIIPSTNPTSTAIYKIFIALKAANAIVISPHPNARRCIAEVAETLGRAAAGAGAPPDSIGCLGEPALEGTNELMRHPSVGVILATGGTGLVRAAYSSGKPAFGVGPGNVPAFVDRTADVAKAASDIIAGKTFDNGVLCSSENAVVADRPIADRLIAAMKERGAAFLDEEGTRRLSRLMVHENGSLNTQIVGKPASAIASLAGIEVPEGTRCLVARLEGVGRDHPLSREKLSPVLAFYTEDGWEACCERVLEILRYGGMGHTMSIHSSDRDIIMKFATTKPVFRICVNTPAAVGAVGLTTGLEPSMTLGCGALGGNITSDNIMPRHLLNTKRLAFETRPISGRKPADPPAPKPCEPERLPPRPVRLKTIDADALRGEVKARLERRLLARAPDGAQAGCKASVPSPPAPSGPAPAGAPPAGSGRDRSPVPFVSEADVRQALDEGRRIVIDARTILTPSARDLGQQHRVFTML